MIEEERQMAENLGVTIATIETLRKLRLEKGVHYIEDGSSGYCRAIQYTDAGREAIRQRVEAGEADYRVCRIYPNKRWVGIDVDGTLRDVEVRDNSRLEVGMRIRCCVLPDQVENLDRSHIPLRLRGRLPAR